MYMPQLHSDPVQTAEREPSHIEVVYKVELRQHSCQAGTVERANKGQLCPGILEKFAYTVNCNCPKMPREKNIYWLTLLAF